MASPKKSPPPETEVLAELKTLRDSILEAAKEKNASQIAALNEEINQLKAELEKLPPMDTMQDSRLLEAEYSSLIYTSNLYFYAGMCILAIVVGLFVFGGIVFFKANEITLTTEQAKSAVESAVAPIIKR